MARTGDVLVFVEVKSRTGGGYGLPTEAIVTSKQRRLVRAAQAFLAWGGFENCSVRFDVVGVHLGPGGRVCSIEHVPDAFCAERPMP